MSLTAEYDRLFIDKQSPEAYRSMSAAAAEVAATAQAAGLDRVNAFNRISIVSGHPVRPRSA